MIRKFLRAIGRTITGYDENGRCIYCGTMAHADFEHSAWAKPGMNCRSKGYKP